MRVEKLWRCGDLERDWYEDWSFLDNFCIQVAMAVVPSETKSEIDVRGWK